MPSFRFDPNFSAIAVTGGPCGGKSTLMARARQWLESRGQVVATLSEGATELIMAGFHPFKGWRGDGLGFQRHLLSLILLREELYWKMLNELDTHKPLVLLCDRGALDALAYIGRESFNKVAKERLMGIHDLRERYKAVIHLVTAAEGAEEYYTLANNQARSESVEEARELDLKTRAAWHGHPHLAVIDNSTDFDRKIHRALTSMARILRMPDPLEKERKFIVITRPALPHDAVGVRITQIYLSSTDSEVERRLRKRESESGCTYYYTEKRPTGEVGVRQEVEREISPEEYAERLREQAPGSAEIQKTRMTFTGPTNTFELDIYDTVIPGVEILEVEVSDMQDEILLPGGWSLKEVTGDKRFSNKRIAEGKFPLEEVRSLVA